jgi:hypothetical protein
LKDPLTLVRTLLEFTPKDGITGEDPPTNKYGIVPTSLHVTRTFNKVTQNCYRGDLSSLSSRLPKGDAKA